MNDKMKTAISIIAIACLCACTSPNEQTQSQPPRHNPTNWIDIPWTDEEKWGYSNWTDEELRKTYRNTKYRLIANRYYSRLAEDDVLHEMVKKEMIRRGIDVDKENQKVNETLRKESAKMWKKKPKQL